MLHSARALFDVMPDPHRRSGEEPQQLTLAEKTFAGNFAYAYYSPQAIFKWPVR